ncbi:cation-transporting P-type ATPase [Thermodesulfovibrio yellowstonii]|uniref:ATPase n=1 Tax=Thermodesulfovibrio yellowstonii TaxID=28262 RepID=A0A9W6GHC6_9BACT|nr:cation-transporting P-type ATPase [Thermodesulfovibrio islandicus]GLI54058.1 ATPase [Thermodesulfovibrio islandicus]
MNWYQISSKEIYQKLNTSEKGLTTEEAQKRLKQYGANRLTEEEKINRLKIFLHQFASPLIYILIIAGVVTILLKEYIDASVIFAAVIINAIIGYFQEYKAEQSVRALKRMLVPKAKVLRDGVERDITSEELVPGDIVLLYSGIRVPADIRLIHTVELKIDESILTGESLPVEKHHHVIKEENLTHGDQKNMAFMGTIVVSGRAKGVVVETGMNTVFGKIAKHIKEAETVKAPLQDKITKFANAIGILVLSACLLLFIAGLIIGESIKDMFMTAVAAAVAAIPEGLPVVVTVALAVGVSRMAKHNAIVRKLHAVETLGSTTVIGSDKTGTLTKNEMTVKVIYDGKDVYEVEGSGYEPKGNILHNGLPVNPKERHHLIDVLRIGLLCNESSVYVENGEYKIQGDPTEAALIVSAMKAGLSPEEEKERYRQIAIIPFESERGYMATLHRHKGKRYIFVKGAPEKVLEMCIKDSFGNEIDRGKILYMANEFAKRGLRILAFAYREIKEEIEEITCKEIEKCDTVSGLIFAGLQGMIDPPRPEAIEAIKGCKSAGIRVVMITGDHAVTAKAIGEMLGISDGKSKVLTGKELERMSDEELFHKVKEVSIYARVSPEHKLRIVKQLKRHGEIVAVTGDGVNDAPALKAAHIGIAMGKSGTDVAKEASDMVLTDDNFASIFHAVREGRIVFDNIRKVTFFLIPTGVASILSIILAMLFSVPIPYVPAQILWINLVTNALQDIALAFEPGEKGVLTRPPRDPKEGIMSRLLIERTIIVGALISAGIVFNFINALESDASLERARTVAVTTMVFFQFFQAWNSRSEYESIFKISLLSNPFLFLSLIAATIAQLAFIYVPTLQWIFRTEPISIKDWQNILLVALSVIIVVEIDKWLRRRWRK